MNGHSKIRIAVAIVAICGASVRPAHFASAQNPDLPPRLAMAADSIAASMAVQAVVEKLAGAILSVQMSAEATPGPWLIDLPRARGVRWEEYEQAVLRLVKGRRPQPEDSGMMVVRISELSMHGDTLVARFTVGARSKCRAEWTGWTTGYEMRAVKFVDWYGGAEVKRTSESDTLPCRAGS